MPTDDKTCSSSRGSAIAINKAQLLLAEKRTALAVMRTGIAVLALPLSVLSVLIATSKYYHVLDVLYLIAPLSVLLLTLIVLGAYLMLYPQARVITLVPVFYFLRIVELPALIYLGFWFVSQLFNGLFALSAAAFQNGGVAWWAHIGGFIFGLAIIRFICPPPCRTYVDQYRPW